jgi:hypothetical protein
VSESLGVSELVKAMSEVRALFLLDGISARATLSDGHRLTVHLDKVDGADGELLSLERDDGLQVVLARSEFA